MDFEEAIACLQDREKCEDYILRLINEGENSEPALNLRDSMSALKMNKTPRGIFEKTMLQHTFKFAEVDECFLSFRLVCKSWKDAVETIRFNRYVGNYLWYELNKRLVKNQGQVTNYYAKYLKTFKKFRFGLGKYNKPAIFNLLLNSMNKLNEIDLRTWGSTMVDPKRSFLANMVQNSQQTLQILNIHNLEFLPKITFPRLTILHLHIRKFYIHFGDFQTLFPNLLQNMAHLDTVILSFYGDKEERSVLEYINENYGKHCLTISTSTVSNALDYVQAKIFLIQDGPSNELMYSLKKFEDKKSLESIEYLYVRVQSTNPMENGWDKYQEFFNQCTNLKSIELICNHTDEILMPENLPQQIQQIWQERISYFNAREIDLVKKGEIFQNENLKIKLAKKVGISWKFFLS